MNELYKFYLWVRYYAKNLKTNIFRFLIRIFMRYVGCYIKLIYIAEKCGVDVTRRYYRMLSYKNRDMANRIYKKNMEIVAIMAEDWQVPQYKILERFDIDKNVLKYTDSKGIVHCFYKNVYKNI